MRFVRCFQQPVRTADEVQELAQQLQAQRRAPTQDKQATHHALQVHF